MERSVAILLLFSLLALLLTGCAASAEKDEPALKIVATDFPCYDFARAVLGSGDNITLLIKPGAEVHSFEPNPSDVVSVMEADLFLYIGGESDSWADSILSSLGSDAPRTLRMFDCVNVLEEELTEGMQAEKESEEGVEYDEHIWTDPQNAARMVRFIADALSELDAERADTYSANGAAYIAQILDLDARIESIVESAARREIVFGDRFPFLYLAKRYGLAYYAAFPGCAAETEPSAQTVMFLIDRVTDDRIPAVYTIEMSSGLIARTIAEETGAKALCLHSMQNVTYDEFSAGETYLSLMEKNAAALEEGLN